MSAHDFENKVQQQMEELNLPPSDAIWNNVELQLRKDKKRRRVLIWLPLLLLGVIGGYFLLEGKTMNNSISSTPVENVNNSVNTKDGEVSKSGQGEKDNKLKDETSLNYKEEIENQKIVTVTDENNNLNTKERKESNTITNDNKTKTSDGFIKSGITISKHDITKNKNANKTADNSKNIIVAEPLIVSTVVNNETTTELFEESDRMLKAAKVSKIEITVDRAALPLSFNMDAFNKPVLTSTTGPVIAAPKVKAKKTDSKWQWGASAGLGVSRVSEGNFFSGLSGASVADANYSASVSSPPLPGIIMQPAAIQAGSSWQAGLFVKRKLTSRFSLSAGLQYGNYSTRSSVGLAVDSQKTISNSSSQDLRVSNFYTTGTSTDYKSRYQYFEIPVNAHIQLNRSKQLPFYWTVGFTYSSLLGTSALHFDGASGVYYEDDNLFRKSQLSWQTGLSIELLSNSKHPIQLGPQLHYNATSLLSGTASQNTHLWGGSLQLRWFFKK